MFFINVLPSLFHSFHIFFFCSYCMTLHLSTWNDTSQSADQLHKFVKPFCNLYILLVCYNPKNLSFIGEFEYLAYQQFNNILDIYIQNKRGLNTRPCGTPLLILIQLRLFHNITIILCPFKYQPANTWLVHETRVWLFMHYLFGHVVISFAWAAPC